MRQVTHIKRHDFSEHIEAEREDVERRRHIFIQAMGQLADANSKDRATLLSWIAEAIIQPWPDAEQTRQCIAALQAKVDKLQSQLDRLDLQNPGTTVTDGRSNVLAHCF